MCDICSVVSVRSHLGSPFLVKFFYLERKQLKVEDAMQLSKCLPYMTEARDPWLNGLRRMRLCQLTDLCWTQRQAESLSKVALGITNRFPKMP